MQKGRACGECLVSGMALSLSPASVPTSSNASRTQAVRQLSDEKECLSSALPQEDSGVGIMGAIL